MKAFLLFTFCVSALAYGACDKKLLFKESAEVEGSVEVDYNDYTYDEAGRAKSIREMKVELCKESQILAENKARAKCFKKGFKHEECNITSSVLTRAKLSGTDYTCEAQATVCAEPGLNLSENALSQDVGCAPERLYISEAASKKRIDLELAAFNFITYKMNAAKEVEKKKVCTEAIGFAIRKTAAKCYADGFNKKECAIRTSIVINRETDGDDYSCEAQATICAQTNTLISQPTKNP